MEKALPLIPLLPFLGFLLNGLLGRRLSRPAVSIAACAGPAISAVLAFAAFLEAADGRVLAADLGDWIRAGELRVPFAFTMDRLSGVMALVVTGVGTLIHVYSIGYMREDPGYARFFAYMNLFMAAMLVLVLAQNLVLLFLGWEGVGLCSYLLIGFWYRDPANCAAGMKAFIVNRIGDMGFLIGLLLVFVTFGTYAFTDINAAVPGKAGSTLFWIGLLLFIGATGKSAQIPLHVWLPDAMAGPTPVSALIHAATMVTSGVYLLARLGPLYSAAPAILPLIATLGVLTAVLAALIAISQTDIKKVLAYSTVSQLGYMFFAAGMGAFGIAIFHLVTHAFFKALLFLGAGGVIHALHHEQDMRRMGGLWRMIPRTAVVFIIGALALAGFPLTSGFFSKDSILHEALVLSFGHGFHPGWFLLWLLGFATAVVTAFYAFRQVSLVFFGEYRGGAASPEGHGPHPRSIHEPPPVMMAPLYILSVLAIAGGFLGVPSFLAGSSAGAHEGGAAGEAVGWVLGGAAALAGIAAAVFLYLRRPEVRLKIQEGSRAARVLARLSHGKFYVDEFYERWVLRPFHMANLCLFYVIDRALIDQLFVGGTGLLLRVLGTGLRKLQTGRIPAYAAWFMCGVLGLLVIVWAAG